MKIEPLTVVIACFAAAALCAAYIVRHLVVGP